MKTTKFKQTEIGMIPEEWEVKPILSFATIKSGKRLPKGRDIVEYNTGFPYIRIRDLQDMSVNVPEVKFLEPDVQNIIKKYIITENDVYISIVGTIGLVGTIPKKLNNANLTENCARLTELKVNRNYLKYFLNSKFGQNQIKSLTVGTTQGKLALSRIAKILVALPSDEEQSTIAKILSDLDSKIELNQQMNKTLEAIGQAIFKRWFVDFEFPNEKGKPYKSSGGEMVDSELGEIPKGWIVGFLGELGRIQPGFAFKSEDFLDEGIGLAKIKNIQPPIVDFNFESYISKELYNKTNNKFYLSSGDILIAMTGAKIGKIGIIPKTENKILLNQRVGKVESNNKYILYLILRTNEVQGFISGGSSASSAQGNISNSDIENFTYLIPDKKFLQKINEVINCLFNRIVDNLGEIQILSQIRDSLLPKLMSGKIRVPVEVRA